MIVGETNVEPVSVKEHWDWFACVLQQYCAMSEEEADDRIRWFTDAVIAQETVREGTVPEGFEKRWMIRGADNGIRLLPASVFKSGGTTRDGTRVFPIYVETQQEGA